MTVDVMHAPRRSYKLQRISSGIHRVTLTDVHEDEWLTALDCLVC